MVTLIEELKRRQNEMGLNDVDFARELKVTRPLWALTKMGNMKVGKTLLVAIYRRFPELAPQVLLFLGQEGQYSGDTCQNIGKREARK